MQQLVDAESAAANILREATVLALHCEGDPGPLYSVAATAAAIPVALAEPRRAAAERLQAVAKEISSMVTKFKSAGEALSRACGALDWMADKKRSLVSRAFASHEVACEEADRTDELLVRFTPIFVQYRSSTKLCTSWTYVLGLLGIFVWCLRYRFGVLGTGTVLVAVQSIVGIVVPLV